MALPKKAVRDGILLIVGLTTLVIALFVFGMSYAIPYLERQQDRRSVERQFERANYHEQLLREDREKNKGCENGN